MPRKGSNKEESVPETEKTDENIEKSRKLQKFKRRSKK